MAKERIEDLGRITAMLEELLKDDVFNIRMDLLGNCRAKDSFEIFNSLSEEHKQEFILECIYGLTRLEESIYSILTIASGEEE